jgi:hypothetical protein
MTFEEITEEIRTQTLGLLDEFDVQRAAQNCLLVNGGITPEDVERVAVAYTLGGIDIGLVLKVPKVEYIDVKLVK